MSGTAMLLTGVAELVRRCASKYWIALENVYFRKYEVAASE